MHAFGSLASRVRLLRRPLFLLGGNLAVGGGHRCRGLLLRALSGAPWQTRRRKAQLRIDAFDLGTEGLTHTMECKRLERHLRNRGVSVLFLKGIALGLQLYGDAAARAGGDIDCLVEARAVPEALEILAALGYEPEGYSPDQIRGHGAPSWCSNMKSR